MSTLPAPRFALGVTIALAVLFPISWFAPLMTVKASFAFWGSGIAVSLISTLQSLWAEDPALALVLSFLTLVAPMLKLLGTGLMLTGLLSPKAKGAIWLLGRFAMADVFLIALYMVIFKGLDIGSISINWGLWAYTLAVIVSLGLSLWLARIAGFGLPNGPSEGKRGT